MDRALVGDFHQFRALFGVELAFDRYHALDLVEHPDPGFAFGAILRVNLAMVERHRHAIQRQRLAVGIHAHGHRGAGAEPGEQVVIGSGSAVVAAGGNGFVGHQAMWPDRNHLLEFAVAGFPHHHLARFVNWSGRLLGQSEVDIAFRPSGDDIGDIGGVKLAGEQMLRQMTIAHPNFRACSLRYFNPIGNHPSGRIGESPKQLAGNLFPIVLSACRERKPVSIYGTDYDTPDGSAVRDFIHVMDVAEGHTAALNYLASAPGKQGTEAVSFNLGTGRGTSVLELLSAVEKAAGTTIERHKSDRRAGDVAISLADPARSAALLGWGARRSLDEACADAMRWLKRQTC